MGVYASIEEVTESCTWEHDGMAEVPKDMGQAVATHLHKGRTAEKGFPNGPQRKLLATHLEWTQCP